MTLLKNDRNYYDGKDEFNITLIDIDGNVIYNEFFYDDDDGNKSKWEGKDEVQVKNFYKDGLKGGLYLMKIKNILGYNKHPDGYIDNIKINTNMIVTLNHLLPVSPTHLYFESPDLEEISFYYWHENKDQIIIVEGDENQSIDLTITDRGKIVKTTLKGKNTLFIPKGYKFVKFR